MQLAEGRFTLVFNGEVYNFRDIRHELANSGEHFQSESDSEVILAACAKWGPEALRRFNGMWALCFYDAREKRGFLARDRFGIKPLLFAATPSRLAFASEMDALLTVASVHHTIDRWSLLHHLVFGYIAHPATIYSAVRRLPPGHHLPFGPAGPAEPVRFYDPVQARRTSTIDYQEARGELRTRIAHAVTARLVSDVPLGAFLSGGLDSSIVVKHAAEATTGRLATFCVGYEGHRNYDERQYARIVARHYDTDHHEIIITQRDALSAVPQVLDHLGEPFGDSSIIPTSLVSKFAAPNLKVALSGDAGDELFAGYWRYSAQAALDGYLRLPAFIRNKLFEPLSRRLMVSKASAVGDRLRQFRKLWRAQGQDTMLRHVAWSRILAPEAEDLILHSEDFARSVAGFESSARRLVGEMPADDSVNRILALDLQYQLPGDMLHKVDLASMMHSLEVRVPLLDFRVVEFALGLPSRYKLDRGQRKRILVDAYRGHLPDQILDRTKQGFAIPVGEFLRTSLRDMFYSVVTRRCVESLGIISYPAVERVFEQHRTRRAEHADLLFALLSLCWWKSRKGPAGA